MRDGYEYEIQLTGVGNIHMPTDAGGLPDIARLDFSNRTGVFQAELIAYDGATEIRAPHPETVLIMPSRRLWRGKTAVRLAEPITP